MKANKKFFLSFILLFLIFFSSCITLEISQVIEKNGVSHINYIYNLSKFKDFKAGNVSNMNFSNKINFSFCNNVNLTGKFKNFGCKFNDESYIGVISGDLQLNSSNGFLIQDLNSKVVYKLDLKKMIKTLNFGAFNSTLFSGTKEKTPILNLSDVKIIYLITMPGEIISTDFGEIKENILIVNYLDLISNENEELNVISEESSIFISIKSIIIIFIILIFIALIGVVIFIVKNKHKLKGDKSLTRNEIHCRDYINKYKKDYTKEQIKTALLGTHISENEINEFIKIYY